MSWGDECYSKDELYGQFLLEAHNLIAEGEAEALKLENEDFLRVHPTLAARLAHEITQEALQSDLSALEGEKMNGVQMYEVSKVSEYLSEVVDAKLKEIMPTTDLTKADKVRLYNVDVFTTQGRRSQMEDRHVIFEDLNTLLGIKDERAHAFFGVYDGHGGVEAAKFVQAQLHLTISQHPAFFADDLKIALKEGFEKTDKDFLVKADREGLSCGATGCVTLVRGKKLYISWLGDSQAMLCRAGTPVSLMVPHKPQHDDEKKRIEDSGGVVVWYGAWRVNGVLSVARAFGDKKLKQWVIGTPDVAEFDLDGSEEYLVLGCDGLWDVMEPTKVVAFIKDYRAKNPSLKGVAQALVEHCLEDLSSSDNISIIIAFFENGNTGPSSSSSSSSNPVLDVGSSSN